MTELQLIENYSPVADMVSFILCAVMMFIVMKVLYFSKDQKFVFLRRALFFVFFASGTNLIFYFAIVKLNWGAWTVFLLRDVYHLSLLMCLYSFILYMKKMLGIKGAFVKAISHVTRAVFCSCLVLDFLSPLTKVGLYYQDGVWYDQMVSPYNAFYMYTVLLLLSMLFFYSRRLIKSVRTCLIVTLIVDAMIMLYQAHLNINTFSTFTFVLPIFVVMILLHSKPFDEKTGSLSANNFEEFVKRISQNNASVDYLVLKLYIEMIDQIPDELGKVLNSFWLDSFKDALLFNLSSDLYVLAIPRNEKDCDSEKKIKSLMNNHFYKYYEQFQIPFKMVGILDVDFIDNTTDILGILKYLLQNMDENTMYLVDDEKRIELRQLKTIRENLKDIELRCDLNEPRVLVYCQPIRNMKTGEFDTAEALMRLELPAIGLVMPNMFIEIAEQYGYIHALSKIMLNKVCRQIKQLENEGYIFNRISVNFTVSEVKNEGFCDEIISIIHKNGVEPSKIGIELTETQTESDFRIVKEKMKKLREQGITLYLDDIGTGYSNLDRIVQYDVDVVIFDRFFLLEAEKSTKIVKMITHLSQAFRDLDYKLLYEGVETEEHESLCMSCGADYIQGFKYSKPIPMEELRVFFKRDKKQ